MSKNLFTGQCPSIPSLDGLLICPIVSCGFNCCHLAACRTGRGSCGSFIEIDMWCENGHFWTYRFEFSHGSTYLEILNAKECDILHVEEMWRD